MKGELKSVTTDYADKSVTIKYGNSGSDKLFIKKAVIYNSTAAYALADNLKNRYFEKMCIRDSLRTEMELMCDRVGIIVRG